MVKKFSFNFPFFGFGIERESKIVLKKGDSIILSEWNWRKFGYKKKVISIDDQSNVIITDL